MVTFNSVSLFTPTEMCSDTDKIKVASNILVKVYEKNAILKIKWTVNFVKMGVYGQVRKHIFSI